MEYLLFLILEEVAQNMKRGSCYHFKITLFRGTKA